MWQERSMWGNRFIEFFRILTYKCNQLFLSSQLKLTQGSFRESRGLQQHFRSDRQNAWRMMDGGLWHNTGDRDQDHPQEKEMQKGKIVWGGLTNSWEKKRSKRQKRKGKIYPFECIVSKNSKERWERLPQWSMQRNRGKHQNRKD